MLSYRVGNQSSHPWGVETVIHIEDDGKRVRSITVMQWPDKDEKLQAQRGAKLIANYLDDLAEQAKPSELVSRAEVEALLVKQGILKTGERVESVKPVSELTAEKVP